MTLSSCRNCNCSLSNPTTPAISGNGASKMWYKRRGNIGTNGPHHVKGDNNDTNANTDDPNLDVCLLTKMIFCSVNAQPNKTKHRSMDKVENKWAPPHSNNGNKFGRSEHVRVVVVVVFVFKNCSNFCLEAVDNAPYCSIPLRPLPVTTCMAPPSLPSLPVLPRRKFCNRRRIRSSSMCTTARTQVDKRRSSVASYVRTQTTNGT